MKTCADCKRSISAHAKRCRRCARRVLEALHLGSAASWVKRKALEVQMARGVPLPDAARAAEVSIRTARRMVRPLRRTTKIGRRHSEETRRDVVGLAAVRGAAAASAQTGVPLPTLYRWIRKAKQRQEGVVGAPL